MEVRSRDEILKTLDQKAELEGMPFMPEMFAFCGRRFQVYKRAHKTCDTVFPVRGRRVADAVHLETRCDGQSHGGCQAGCLIFWKTAWLKPASPTSGNLDSADQLYDSGRMAATAGCTEEQVGRAAVNQSATDSTSPAFVCQATRLPYATTSLNWWEIGQYIEDYTSGNEKLGRMLRGFIYMGYNKLINAGIGLGALLRWFYDRCQRLWNGVPYPRKLGRIPAGERTPHGSLDLQPGDWVRVKSYEEILATCDANNKNRGLFFDAEMVPHCGKTYRVLKRVTNILDEKTGRMLDFKNPCIILDSVFCESRYSECRLFCPRSIYSYWREIWLEKVSPPGTGSG